MVGRTLRILTAAAVLVPLCGRAAEKPARAQKPQWTAKLVKVVDGFDVPEGAVVDPARKAVYVSNIVAPKQADGSRGFWANDGVAYLSRLKLDGTVDVHKWRPVPGVRLNAPKGMCICDDVLYVADIRRVVRLPLKKGGRAKAVRLPGMRFNDMATDGRFPYVSDTGMGAIWRLKFGPRRLTTESLGGIPGVNGITFHRGRLFAVSWTKHDVYEVDLKPKTASIGGIRVAPTVTGKPFGLAGHFKNLDGIEVLDDGTFVVSDNTGNKLCTISADRKTVRTLIELDTPADFALDRKNSVLYIPQLTADKVAVYKLQKK